MLIDYLLSKMSGRPGLLLTTQSLLTKDGAYKDITDDIDKYIEKLKEQVKIENATEALKAAYTAYDKASKSAGLFNPSRPKSI